MGGFVVDCVVKCYVVCGDGFCDGFGCVVGLEKYVGDFLVCVDFGECVVFEFIEVDGECFVVCG